MLNQSTNQFKAIRGPGNPVASGDLFLIGTYPSIAAMSDYTVTTDSSLQLPQGYKDVNPASFATPQLNMGVWFQLPVIPAQPKMIYFLQLDGTVKLYNIENIVNSTLSFGRLIKSFEEQSWIKYK